MEFTAIRASTAAEHDGMPDQTEAPVVEKEHMFDKVVTRSDVGKLNRLVIPKKYAEKYFPLDAPSTNKQGLLLSFEDPTGKPWHFRYSYWNSNQSYVMTKGWSRFVKDKHLDAGDTVAFGRGVWEATRGRLFIDCHRRPHRHVALAHHPVGSASPVPSPASVYHRRHDGYGAAAGRQVLFYRPQQQYHHHHQSVVLDRKVAAAPGHPEPMVTSGSKRVRLFGVNLECATDTKEAADAAAVAGVVVVQESEVLFECEALTTAAATHILTETSAGLRST